MIWLASEAERPSSMVMRSGEEPQVSCRMQRAVGGTGRDGHGEEAPVRPSETLMAWATKYNVTWRSVARIGLTAREAGLVHVALVRPATSRQGFAPPCFRAP